MNSSVWVRADSVIVFIINVLGLLLAWLEVYIGLRRGRLARQIDWRHTYNKNRVWIYSFFRVEKEKKKYIREKQGHDLFLNIYYGY